MNKPPRTNRASFRVAGLFAGIGGLELGFHQAGHETVLLCESDPGAKAVLKRRFPGARFSNDVRTLRRLGAVDVVSAGFPCQDLSQAGRTAGIGGGHSGLVGHVFRLLNACRQLPRWVVFENVSFMLHLDRGRALRFLVDELEARGMHWAYRVVDTLAFGLPQRRHRVILIASASDDPKSVLFADNRQSAHPAFDKSVWCGFYWTEGLRGLGWAIDSVPTLKGGSTIGIPSPPAIWNPRSGDIATPEIRDAERLQGFEAGWTLPAIEIEGVRRGHRWKLVGNAVSVPVAKWIGERLAAPGRLIDDCLGERVRPGMAWPRAGFGGPGTDPRAVMVSDWPVAIDREHLASFIRYPMVPLSARAASGFKSRLDVSPLKYPREFGLALASYVRRKSIAVA